MKPTEEAQQAGFALDVSPPLADSRRPLAMAFRQHDDGSFLAVCALEVERFEIGATQARADAQGDRGSAPAPLPLPSVLVADALAALGQVRELVHVIATRARPSEEGALLRVGWLAIGRGATAHAAAMQAESTWVDVHDIQVAALDHATLAPVVTEEALTDLLRPLWASHCVCLHRLPWSAVPYVRRATPRAPASQDDVFELLPRWPARPLAWSPMVSALAAQQEPAALAVFLETQRMAPDDVVRAEQERALRLQRDLSRTKETSTESSVILSDGSELLGLVRWRLETLRGPGTACRVVLATSAPASHGLRSVAASAFGSPSYAPEPGAGQLQEPRVAWRSVEAGSLSEPVDLAGAPDLLLGADELHRFARTLENPDDEKSPVPCARTRHLDLRCAESPGVSLGVANLRGREFEVRLDEAQRFQHVYLIGQTGTGKSTLMLRMIIEDVQNGHGVTVIDPHGNLIEAVLRHVPGTRADDVVLVDPSDIERSVPLNPLHLTETDSVRYAMARDRVIDDLLDVFDALYDLKQTGGPMFEMYFRAFMSLLLGAQKPTDYEPVLPMLETVFADGSLRKALIGRLDPVLRNTVKTAERAGGEASLANIAPYVTSKTTRFYAPLAARRMLCQSGCLDFDDVLRARRILLVSISPTHLGKEGAALIARQIIFRLNQAGMARGASPQQPAHFLYVDEFHNFATERFASMLAEARKFRLGLVLAHQYTSQLIRKGDRSVLDAVLGNVGTIVAFRLGSVDAESLARAFAPRATTTDIVGLPNHVAIARAGGPLGNIPFTLRTRPEPEGNGALAGRLRELARLKFAKRGPLVDAELGEAIGRLERLKSTGGS